MAPILVLSLLPSTLAADLPEVAVVGVHVAGLDEAAGEAAALRIGEAVTRTGTMEYVEPQKVSSYLKGREDLVIQDMATKAGDAKLQEGRVLYERAEPEAAMDTLSEAIAQLTAGVSLTGDPSRLVEALLVMGLVQTAVGNTDAAQLAWEQVLVLDPQKVLDSMSYPPEVIEGFEATRARLQAQGKGSIEIRSADGSPAEVLVDGRGIGQTPLTVKDLPPGVHYVLVKGADGRRSSTEIELSPGESESWVAPLDARVLTPAAASSTGRSRQTEALYRAVGTYCQTPLVLLAGQVSPTEVAVLLYSPRSGNFSQALTSRAGEDPVQAIVDLIPALGSYVTESGDIRGDRVSFDVPPFAVDNNAVLAQILLDPNEEVQVQYLEKGPNWFLIGGLGVLAVGGTGTATWLVLRDEDGPAGPNGVITFGPIPE